MDVSFGRGLFLPGTGFVELLGSRFFVLFGRGRRDGDFREIEGEERRGEERL